MKKLTGMCFLVLALSVSVAQAMIEKNAGKEIKTNFVEAKVLRAEIGKDMKLLSDCSDVSAFLPDFLSKYGVKLFVPKDLEYSVAISGICGCKEKELQKNDPGINAIPNIISLFLACCRKVAFDVTIGNAYPIVNTMLTNRKLQMFVCEDEILQHSIATDDDKWLSLFSYIKDASDKK